MRIERWSRGESKPGVPADAWNAMADAAEFVAQLKIPGTKTVDPQVDRPTNLIYIENASDEDVELGRPLVYGAPIFGPAESNERPVFSPANLSGTIPNSGEYAEPPSSTAKWALTMAAIPAGQIGLAATHGLAWAYVTVRDAAHTTCGLNADPGEYEDGTLLVSGVAGAQIVWKQAEDDEYVPEIGEQWCLILMGGSSSSGGATSQFALVTAEADSPSYDDGEYDTSLTIGPSSAAAIGKAVLLEYSQGELDGHPFWKLGAPDPGGEYGDYTDDQQIWVYCVHKIARLDVGDLVEVCTPFTPMAAGGGFGGDSGNVTFHGITAGLYDSEENPTVAYPAKHVSPNEFFHTIDGGGVANKVIFSDDGGRDTMRWAGRPCQEPES